MQVFKFGGASVKDAEGVKNLVKILQQEKVINCVVVVSAMGKMTNAFEALVNAILYNPEEKKKAFNYIKNFHEEILSKLFDPSSQEYQTVNELLDELYIKIQQISSKDYDFVYDQIVGYGELLSTKIVSEYLNQSGVKNQWLDVRGCIKTDSTYRDANVLWEETEKNIQKNINIGKINIVQGFIAADKKGNTTTLGREGSDYTAGIFAYCLDAKNVTIWKDVAGVLNADPRAFKETKLLKKISYEEAIEMAFYGASVIHPKTIQPLQSKNISLFVRSFNNPKTQGTEVTRGAALEPMMPCFIVKKNQILVSIATKDFSFIVENNISEIFQLLHDFQLKTSLIQNSAISFSICVDNKFHQFDNFVEAIQSHYKVDFVKEVDLYTIRHFNTESIKEIERVGKPLLTQVNKETKQIVIKPSDSHKSNF